MASSKSFPEVPLLYYSEVKPQAPLLMARGTIFAKIEVNVIHNQVISYKTN